MLGPSDSQNYESSKVAPNRLPTPATLGNARGVSADRLHFQSGSSLVAARIASIVFGNVAATASAAFRLSGSS